MVKIGTILDVIQQEMEDGVYDFTKDGKCSGCGSCCSRFLPVSGKEVKAIRRYVRKKKIQEQRHFYHTASPQDDWTCPFRSESDRKCIIYKVRPAICRDFQCDKPRKQIEADKSLYHGRFSVVDMREEFFG